jgi:DNA repair protein RadC
MKFSIGVNIVSIETLYLSLLSLVDRHEVFKPAILLNACAIFAVHKSPLRRSTPSLGGSDAYNTAAGCWYIG